MPNRYASEHDYRRGQDRPRDEYGRFEPDSEQERSSSSQDRPRDEYGRFESIHDQRWSQDRPRDEYGRFESEPDRGRMRERQSYYRSGENYMSRQNRAGEERGERDYGTQGPWEGRGRSNGSFGNDYSDRSYDRSSDWPSPMGSGRESYRVGNAGWRSSQGYGEGGFQNRGAGTETGGRWSHGTSSIRGEGQYAGRGPKGYRRADDRIEEDVNEALTDSPDLDASEIEVKVSNGEVTLSGSVAERSAKRMAEDIAERCSGVKDVRNEIRVQREHDSGNGQSQLKSKSATGTSTKAQESKTA